MMHRNLTPNPFPSGKGNRIIGSNPFARGKENNRGRKVLSINPSAGTKSRIVFFSLGAGLSPADGSVKPTAGFTLDQVICPSLRGRLLRRWLLVVQDALAVRAEVDLQMLLDLIV